MAHRSASDMLQDRFVGKKHAVAAVNHFGRMVQDYQRREWDDANAKAGKFVEAVLKALWAEAGEIVPTGKAFKAGVIMDTIDKRVALPDSLRLTIPRACRFIYEVASNRGARHDADEIAANEMDANAVISLSSWVLAEMISYAQKGLDLTEAKAVVDGIITRKYPFMETIDGRVYIDIANSAREAALLILYGIYPKRIAEEELIKQVARHGYKRANAEMGVKRVLTRVDKDDNGNLKLRNLGVQDAEALIARSETAK
jgi:hypothetical protein